MRCACTSPNWCTTCRPMDGALCKRSKATGRPWSPGRRSSSEASTPARCRADWCGPVTGARRPRKLRSSGQLVSPRPDLGPKPHLGYTESLIERAAEKRNDEVWLQSLFNDRRTLAYVVGGELIVL